MVLVCFLKKINLLTRTQSSAICPCKTAGAARDAGCGISMPLDVHVAGSRSNSGATTVLSSRENLGIPKICSHQLEPISTNSPLVSPQSTLAILLGDSWVLDGSNYLRLLHSNTTQNKVLWLCSMPLHLGLTSVLIISLPLSWLRFRWALGTHLAATGCCEGKAAAVSTAWMPGQQKALLCSSIGRSVQKVARCPLLCFRKERVTLKVIKKCISMGMKRFYQGRTCVDVCICHLWRKLHTQPPCWGYKSTVNYTGQIFFSLSPPFPPPSARHPLPIYLYIYLFVARKKCVFCRIIKHCCINKVRRSNERGDAG